MKNVAALAAGIIFAVGLALSGMTQPAKIVGFLDFFGSWDPSMMFVMMGAIGFYLPFYRLVTRRSAPLYSERFWLPTRKDIDKRLILGSMLFGAGWGIGGYCPGPAVTSLGAGSFTALLFTFCMLLGMGAFTLMGKPADG